MTNASDDPRRRLVALLSAPHTDWLAPIAGALLPLAFAPIGWYPFAILSPLVLFLLWRGVAPRGAAWRGFLFGLGQFGVGVSWVYVAIHDFGYTSMPLAVFLTSLFVSFFALYVSAAGWLAARFLPGPDVPRLGLLLPATWTALDWFRGWFLTGFPWLNLGYSQIDAPLRGYAPLLGVYGVTFVTALSAGLLAVMIVSARRTRLAAGAGLAALWLCGALLTHVDWTEPVDGPIKVSLVQGNIPQDTKWRPELAQRSLDTYAGLTREHWNSRLILWPEAAITLFYHEVANDFLAPLAREASRHGASLVLGIPVRDPADRRYYNSLVSLDAPTGFYHKRHLVPFGDFVPFADVLRGLIRFFDLPMSGFSPGPDRQPLLAAAGQKLGASVCYEDIFGEEVIGALPEASLLVNATNNAWYGDSFAPHQHLEMSRMRALETGRPMLRVTTNGVSAIIDEFGRIRARSEQFATAVVSGEAQPRRGATPYVRFGNWPVVVLVLVILAIGTGRGWRRRGSQVE